MAASEDTERTRLEAKRREAVETARRMLSGDLSLLAGCRRLVTIGHALFEDPWNDPDFSVLGALDSETDHLPLEGQHDTWDPIAYAGKQLEVARIEADARSEVMTACRSIMTRFGAV